MNWTQKECKKYREEKEARKEILKIALTENIEQLKRAVKAISVEAQRKYGGFRVVAQMRFTDILHWLELQKDSNGYVPQKVRELSVFWALVSAKQAGLITSYEEFSEMAQKLIDFCGHQFATECTVATVKSAFTKDYKAKTATLIETLQITPEAQKEMKVLLLGRRVTSKKQPLQNRDEYLATHDQERRKPWELYGFSRRTYFRKKKAGTLPPLPTQLQISTPAPQFEKGTQKSGTSDLYIMTRARVASLSLVALSCWLELLLHASDASEGASGGFSGSMGKSIQSHPYRSALNPNPVPCKWKSREWLQLRSLLYFKRRRKSKRKRKRKRG